MNLEDEWQRTDAAMQLAKDSHNCEALDEAVNMRIAVANRAKRESPKSYPDALVNAISALLEQSEECNSRTSLDQALEMLDQNEQLLSGGPHGGAYLGLRAFGLMAQALRGGDSEIMRESVGAYRRRDGILSKQDSEFGQCRLELGIALREYGLMSGSWREIYEAVRVLQALERKRDSSVDGVLLRAALGTALLNRFLYRPRENPNDLPAAIESLNAAVQDMGLDHQNGAAYLSDLGAALMRHYEYEKNDESLARAIRFHRQAVETTPERHARRGDRQYNLASALMADHERTDDPGTLDEAIGWFRAAAGTTEPDSAHYARCLYQLATALFRRGELRDMRFDYDEAATRAGQAVAATPPESVNLAERAAFHGVALIALGTNTQLAVAEELLRAAILKLPHGPGRIRIESNHGVVLEALARHTSNPERSRRYAEEAVERTRHAVTSTSPDHSEYPGRLLNYAAASVTWAALASDAAALDTPLRLCQQFEKTSSAGQSESLIDLAAAQLLSCRFELLKDEAAPAAVAAAEAVSAYRRAAEAPGPNTIRRLNAACHGADLATRSGVPNEGLELYTLAIELLDKAAWRGIHRRDQERLLGEYGRLPSNAAGMAISAGQLETAVEFLERGRGVLMDRMIDDSTDLAPLAELAPDLAEELGRTLQALEESNLPDVDADEVDLPARPAQEASEADKRSILAREVDRLISQIRDTPGSRQLFRPLKFSDLQDKIGERLVTIINIGDYRCDALNIASATLTVTTLPEMTRQEAEDAAEFFRDHASKAARQDQVGWNARRQLITLLGNLWEWIAEPVLSDIGIVDAISGHQTAPRIYWCPTGPAVFLPLHAAGIHGKDQTPNLSVIERAESSYLPKLRLLAKRDEIRVDPPGWDERPLVVSMPTTPGMPPLPGAAIDAAFLLELFPDATSLSGSTATRMAVLEAIRTHAWHHFSLHGVTDTRTPTASGLELSDGRLSISDLEPFSLSGVRFTFLSACETYQGTSAVPDEVITLGGAFLIAGCETTIATLWPVQDSDTSHLVRQLYEKIVVREGGSAHLRTSSSSHALRAASLALRNANADHPERWAAFVHSTIK